MDKTKSKLAAFFDNDDEESSLPPKTVDDAKLSQYAAGTVRKSRREREKEAAEAKKREEEEHAAKAFAEFIDAFEGDGASRTKAGSGFVKSSAESRTAYAPITGKTSERIAAPTMNRSLSPSAPMPKPKGKRAMDAFLEEIKRDQAEREARYSRHVHGGRSVTAMAAYDGQSGSKDRGDPQTSNIFVANLPPHVTEQILGNFFARAGPVGSVKVMWPRSDGTSGPGSDMTNSRRSKNAGLSGFVSFMKRKDAERALREFDGFDWGGSILRVGWSKAVPIASKPLYVAEIGRSKSPSRSRSRDRKDRRFSRSPDRRRHYSHSRSWSRERSPKRRRERSRSRRSHSPRRYSRSPVNRNEEGEAVTDIFIRAVAAEVKGQDAGYFDSLREREKNNPKYAFLRKDHRRHAFYRGLIESKEPLEAEFDDEGYNSVYSTDSAEESERERVRKTTLGRLARQRFEAMVRSLTGRRGEIARCMAFSLEHAEAAHEVADIIVASLLVDGTAVPRKVARLHLICDILHNSAASVPSAWKFRLEFQSRLGIVFDHLSNIYHSFPGRITAETFKKQITSVVDIWDDWIVFPPDFTTELRHRLDGAVKEMDEGKAQELVETVPMPNEAYSSRFKTSTFQVATAPSAIGTGLPEGDGDAMELDSDGEGGKIDIDGVPVDDLDGEPVYDVDGEQVDADGEPIDDLDGEPIRDDIDDIPMADDLDGVPIEDVDGEPITE